LGFFIESGDGRILVMRLDQKARAEAKIPAPVLATAMERSPVTTSLQRRISIATDL